jgi:SIR2-like domain
VLFLGAGASKAVDIDDLSGLTIKVNNKIERTYAQYHDLSKHIVDTLVKANKSSKFFFNKREIDIEVLFSVLNALTNHTSKLKDLGPYAIYIDQLRKKKLPYEGFTSDRIEKIRSIVEEVITESCTKFSHDKAIKCYRDLFECEKELRHRYVNALGNLSRISIFTPVVTTNYDLVLEELRDDLEQEFSTGFKKESEERESYLQIEEIMRCEIPQHNLQYLKLHGSINWWIRDRDKKVVQRDSATSLTREKYKDRLMVYPVYEKYISRNPYFALYCYFRRILYYHDLIVVIGFSFRDQSINNALGDVLINRPESRIVIINKNPNSIKQRIRANFPNNKVDIIKHSFGDDGLCQKLGQVICNKPRGI